jgi:F-type H+-transporting ATPase subunit b
MDIQLPQIIFQIINFSVVMGALTYLLYRPIQKIMDERVSKIKEGQEAAQAAIDEKQNLAEFKTKIEREAERKAAAVVDEAVKRANQQRQDILAKAKEEAKLEVEKQRADWQTERAQLITAARQEMVDTILAVSAKVIEKKLDEKTEGAFITRELEKALKQ